MLMDTNGDTKILLLKDLCSRLPYGVKYQTYLGDIFTLKDITLSRTTTQYYIDDNAFSLSQIKPYLRPMSSMTEEEKKMMRSYGFELILYDTGCTGFANIENYIDEISFRFMEEFLNAHYFDYHGLIPMGLALPATEGMYNIKKQE